MRELLWMVDARQRCEWALMSNLMSLLANINRDPKKSKVFKPTDFNPYYFQETERVTITKDNMDILRQAVVGIAGMPTNSG